MRVLLVTIASLGLSSGLCAQTSATFGQVVRLGATPSDVVLDESRHRLYLVNTAANRIDIFSTTTNAVSGSIQVGQGPLAAAISRDNAWLYVTNGTDKTLSVVDLNAGGVSQVVPMPAVPQGVAVGGDGTALVSTLDTSTAGTNTLVRFDRTQTGSNQLTSVLTPPPPATPAPTPPTTITTPVTKFLGKLATTPDGNYIVGVTNLGAANQTYLFVYEVSSGSILRSRTVTGQSTVLSISPDGSRFMAGYTLYEVATLSILGQMNNANAPFPFPLTFSTVQNVGGSVFSPDEPPFTGLSMWLRP
jgi:WD40 repeat protein